jgi:multisubunit Na+/H+ antiporter MnhE subunit
MENIMMTILAGILFAMALTLSLTEAIVERDWPTRTFRFVLLFGVLFWISCDVFSM